MPKAQRDIPNTNEIVQFFHCRRCLAEVSALAEKEGSASPRDYARLSVGFTPIGYQVWCNRHDINIVHIDFEGHTHPANLTSKREGTPGNA